MGRSWAAFLLVSIAVFLLAVTVSAGSAAGDPGAEKEQVDAKIQDLEAAASDQKARAGVLTEELSAAAGRVRELDGAVSAQEARLGLLADELASAQARLTALDDTIQIQTARLKRARGAYGVAVTRLEQRVHDLYVAGDPDVMSFVLGISSFSDILDNVELLNRIGQQDERIVLQVASARNNIARARKRSLAARVEAAELATAVGRRVAEQRALVERAAASRNALVAAQADRRSTIAAIEGDRDGVLAEIAELERQSATLAATIRASQPVASTVVTGPTGGGPLAWPVSGPVTSGFGMRWGRMHEGIDIMVASGTPVGASAPGTVIYAGWLGGYGNLVVVDHGGGLATAYAHNSSFAAGVGQLVETGTVIAYSGSTGNSSGPHVHFEVRVNGTAVDPLGYL
jgi:murein DD-endopeptidase MepM/ murein hydrolase activator NlpD